MRGLRSFLHATSERAAVRRNSRSVTRRGRQTRGAGVVEYALIISLVGAVCFTGVQAVGSQTGTNISLVSQAFGSSTGKQGPPACSNQSCPTTTGLTNLNRWGQYITTGVEDQNGIVGDEFYVLGTNLDSVTSVFMGAYPLTYPDWYDLNGSYLAIIIPGWIPVGNYSVEVENSYGYSPASQKMKITVGPPEFSVAFDLSNIPWSTGPATDNAEIQGDGFMNNISGENAVLGVKFGHYTLTPGNGTNPGTYDVVNGNAIFFTPPAGVPDGTYTMAVDTYQGLAQGVTMTYEITG